MKQKNCLLLLTPSFFKVEKRTGGTNPRVREVLMFSRQVTSCLHAGTDFGEEMIVWLLIQFKNCSTINYNGL